MAGKKFCPFCHIFFTPHPKVGDRQICCGRESCKRQRKKAADRKWRRKNPDYFKGRYQISTKPWLLKHPHYLRDYRRRKRENAPFVRPPQIETCRKTWPGLQDKKTPTKRALPADIQDELTLAKTMLKPQFSTDIQDKLTLVNSINYLLFYFINDIQDALMSKETLAGKGFS